MISDEADYAFVTAQFRSCSEAIRDALNGYIRLVSAIAAGSIYLRIQPGMDASEQLLSYAILSNAALALAALIAVTQILENIRSRRGYRVKMSKLGGEWPDGTPKIPLPKRGSVWIESVMLFSIISSLLLFVALNPFRPVVTIGASGLSLVWPSAL